MVNKNQDPHDDTPLIIDPKTANDTDDHVARLVRSAIIKFGITQDMFIRRHGESTNRFNRGIQRVVDEVRLSQDRGNFRQMIIKPIVTWKQLRRFIIYILQADIKSVTIVVTDANGVDQTLSTTDLQNWNGTNVGQDPSRRTDQEK